MTGTFLLTWDTEALWGDPERRVDKGTSLEMGQRFRSVLRDILALLDEYDISATFAVVGHLYLDGCSSENGKHPEMVHPRHSWFKHWYDNDPCTDHVQDPGWYAPEIIDWIRNSRVDHEIACHSFSHCVFGDYGCTRDVAVSEILRCKRLACTHGVPLKSFVFPRNSIGHLDVLKDNGFLCYRGHTCGWYSVLPAGVARVGGIIDEFLPTTPRLVTPYVHQGIVDIPGSMLIRSRRGWRRLIPVRITDGKAVHAIRYCASRNGVFHLWSHPMNLAWNRDAMFAMLKSVVGAVSEERDRGRLNVMTMGQYAEAFVRGSS